mmetsp:Transcript_8640/g.12746  ORF Transcript_8640/g.12746 Transcript_8640/m.12746 type:complete len:131 (-) Transcript_8640:153-545(-)
MMQQRPLHLPVATLFVLALLLPQQSHAKKKKNSNKNRKLKLQINKQREKCQEICTQEFSVDDEQQTQSLLIDPFSAKSMACVTKCMSEECHVKIYKQDELEDGEVDKVRASSFNDCLRTDLLKRNRSTWL